jgi:hypothetical protein
MHHRRLVTPVEKVWHRRPVRRRCHVASHTLLAVPRCHGPKCPFAIGQNRSALKSGGVPELTAGAEEMHGKGGQEADRSHPQTSYADKRHSQVSRRRGQVTPVDSGCGEPILVSQTVSSRRSTRSFGRQAAGQPWHRHPDATRKQARCLRSGAASGLGTQCSSVVSLLCCPSREGGRHGNKRSAAQQGPRICRDSGPGGFKTCGPQDCLGENERPQRCREPVCGGRP